MQDGGAVEFLSVVQLYALSVPRAASISQVADPALADARALTTSSAMNQQSTDYHLVDC